MYRAKHLPVERGNQCGSATRVNSIWSERFHIAPSFLSFVGIMRERDSFRKRSLLTKIEDLIAKKEADKNKLPYEEYKSDAQYIQGYVAGLEEARRIIKGAPSAGWRPSVVHQRLVQRRKKGRIRTAGEESRATS